MSGAAPSGAGSDPSMEDILASIRRILSEDETPAPPPPVAAPLPAAAPARALAPAAVPPPAVPPPAVPPPAAPSDDVLALDASMMEAEAPPPRASPPVLDDKPPVMAAPPRPEPRGVDAPRMQPPPPLAAMIDDDDFNPPPLDRGRADVAPPRPAAFADALAGQLGGAGDAFESLVAPEAAAAAASSMGSLRKLAAERGAQVYRSGPTIEDVVREEMRPMLKEWLDTHLPILVERLVRMEIERVVSGSFR